MATKSSNEFRLPTLGGTRITKLLCSKLDIKEGVNILVASVNLQESIVYLAENFNCKIYGIYELPQVVILAKSELMKHNLDEVVNVKVMSPVSLDFEDESFDLIIAEGILSQYKKNRILREFNRVLKNNSQIAIADFYWKKTPVPTYVMNAWSLEGGTIETLDEKLSMMESNGFEILSVNDVSDELVVYYTRFKKIIQSSLRERKFTKSEFKEVKKFKHEVSVFLEQGGDKWMGYVAIVGVKRKRL